LLSASVIEAACSLPVPAVLRWPESLCFSGFSRAFLRTGDAVGELWCDETILCRSLPALDFPARTPNMGPPKTEATKMLSKSQLVEKITAELDGLSKKDVKGVLESLVSVGHKELKKSGTFLVPGFAKFVVIKKPATKEREGINPFTKEPTVFKAKPARKIVRARPVKAAKDAV
jgi:DNA-binding protein HU-beta